MFNKKLIFAGLFALALGFSHTQRAEAWGSGDCDENQGEDCSDPTSGDGSSKERECKLIESEIEALTNARDIARSECGRNLPGACSRLVTLRQEIKQKSRDHTAKNCPGSISNLDSDDDDSGQNYGGSAIGGGSFGSGIAPKPQPAPVPAPVASSPTTPGYCSAWVCGQNGNALCANWIGSGTPPTKYCSDLPGSSGGNNGNGGMSECSGFNFAHMACQSHTGCVYNYDTQHCSAKTSNCQQERVCNSEDSNGNGTDCSFQEVCH